MGNLDKEIIADFGYESALDSTLDSMERIGGLTVTHRSKTPPQTPIDVETVKRELAQVTAGIPYQTAKSYIIGSDRIHLGWYRNDCGLSGEFSIRSLHSCLIGNYLTFDDERLTGEQQETMGNLKVFEETPGNGRMTGLLFPDTERVPDIWLYDISQPILVRLDIDFTTYLDTLLTTKGVLGWQYLFADLDLSSHHFRSTVTDLKEMLDYLPRLFPERNYEPLNSRLEARL